jgi:hypothetical protein
MFLGVTVMPRIELAFSGAIQRITAQPGTSCWGYKVVCIPANRVIAFRGGERGSGAYDTHANDHCGLIAGGWGFDTLSISS